MSKPSSASRRLLGLVVTSWMLLAGGCELSPGIDFPTTPDSTGSDASGADGIDIGDGGLDGIGIGEGGSGNLEETANPSISTETTMVDSAALGGGGAGGDGDAGLGGAPVDSTDNEALGGSTP